MLFNPLTALCAFGCSTFSPSISQRYCSGVSRLASASLRGYWKLPDSRRLYSSRKPSPSHVLDMNGDSYRLKATMQKRT